jgi:hypothetical protein
VVSKVWIIASLDWRKDGEMSRAEKIEIKVEPNVNGEFTLSGVIVGEDGENIRYLTKFLSREELLAGARLNMRIEGMPIHGDKERQS